jgi:hypothetical protein
LALTTIAEDMRRRMPELPQPVAVDRREYPQALRRPANLRRSSLASPNRSSQNSVRGLKRFQKPRTSRILLEKKARLARLVSGWMLTKLGGLLVERSSISASQKSPQKTSPSSP